MYTYGKRVAVSPNQPLTPISSFRLDETTKTRIQSAASQMGVSMTEVIRRNTEAFAAFGEALKAGGLDASSFPFEARIAGLNAYRDEIGYEAGEIMETRVVEAINAVIAASWPIICADKIDQERRRTLVDVIQRLEGHGVDEDVVAHFVSLLD